MKTVKILIATNNKNKAREFSEIFGKENFNNIETLMLSDIGFFDEIVEDADTFEGNSLIKARAGASVGYTCIGDDSGLMVDALDGEPGIYSARYAGCGHDDSANNRKLLARMKDVPIDKRTAKFVCCISCAFPNGDSFTVRGECNGRILFKEQGKGGFGYDPLFYVDKYAKTFAELSSDEKNSVSHRGRAAELFIKKFIEYIKENNIC